MKLRDLVKEGMSIWIPDAEKNKVTKKCPECDGKGFSAYIGDNHYYTGDMDNVRDQVIKNDKEMSEIISQIKYLKQLMSYNSNHEKTPDWNKMLQSLNKKRKQGMKRVASKVEWILQGEREECWQCGGDGTIEAPDVDYPPMHLSNRNARLVMDALGYPPNDDYWYEIKHTDVPEVKRTIMKYLNSGGLSSYTVDTTVSQEDRGWKKTTADDGVIHIEKDKGPRMTNVGVDEEYFRRIFKALMPMLDHAQKNKMDISIG